MLTDNAVGPYRIGAKIGEGGMGQVYRARDTRLDRDVAIKILPEAFATDTDRLRRFEREAKTLAALNHPHIAQVYGTETADGRPMLVMELVEGEDLAARLAAGPMPFDEAMPIARQIAEALEAAHGQGIIHRDLKPANIRVRPDGTVKVLDFGLAKPAAAEATSVAAPPMNSPTFTSPAMTQLGIILGTAAYMSPEQANGRPLDRRTDVWAFGCVLYEMLTGLRVFEGDDVSDTLALVLKGVRSRAGRRHPPDARRDHARGMVARWLDGRVYLRGGPGDRTHLRHGCRWQREAASRHEQNDSSGPRRGLVARRSAVAVPPARAQLRDRDVHPLAARGGGGDCLSGDGFGW
jgi:serine/threonine protein kinase